MGLWERIVRGFCGKADGWLVSFQTKVTCQSRFRLAFFFVPKRFAGSQRPGNPKLARHKGPALRTERISLGEHNLDLCSDNEPSSNGSSPFPLFTPCTTGAISSSTPGSFLRCQPTSQLNPGPPRRDPARLYRTSESCGVSGASFRQGTFSKFSWCNCPVLLELPSSAPRGKTNSGLGVLLFSNPGSVLFGMGGKKQHHCFKDSRSKKEDYATLVSPMALRKSLAGP